MLTFSRTRQLARRFSGVEESTSYGTPALKVRKKLVLRLHDKADAIVMLLDGVATQQALMARDPMAFYITDHYAGYPAVLVRPTVEEAVFLQLLEARWRQLARKADVAAYDAAADGAAP